MTSDTVALVAATIIAASLGAAVAAIVGWRQLRIAQGQLQISREQLDRTARQQEALGDIFKSIPAVRARAIRVESRMIDPEGTERRLIQCEGVHTSPSISVNYIPGRSWSDDPGATVQGHPRLVSVSSFPKNISLYSELIGPQRADIRLTIAGGLTSDDPPFDYAVETMFANGVMTPEQVRQHRKHTPFPHDYFSYDIVSLLADTLELVVDLAYAKPVRLYPGVFWGPADWIFHTNELQRVQGGFRVQGQRAQFRVDGPRPGFRYVIYWDFV